MPVLPKKFNGIATRHGGQGWGKTRLYVPGSRFDYETEAGDLWSNSVIALGLDWLGSRFPRPVMQVARISARSGDHAVLGRHGLVDLWNRPNPYYGRRTLEKAVGLSLKVDGNAYIYKVRDRMGKVAQLWWIPHFRISPTWPEDGSAFIDGYKIWADSHQVVVPPADVVHIRDGIDPRNERYGLSATKACIREVCTVNMESGYTSSLLRNSAVPGLMIVPREGWRPTPDDADAMRERLHDFYAGDQAGTALIASGSFDVQPVGYSPEAMLLDRLPQAAVARVAASIGVTPMSLGLPDPNKTYANLAEANRTSWGTVVAIQEIVDETLRWQLLPDFGDDPHKTIVERDYSHIQELQESLDAVHARTREDWKAGIITRGEAREQLGYNIGGEDEPEYTGEFDDRFFPGTGGEDPVDMGQPGDEDPADALGGLADANEPGPDGEPEPKPGKTEPEDEEKSLIALGNHIRALGLMEHFKAGTLTPLHRLAVVESIRTADAVKRAAGLAAFPWSDERIHGVLGGIKAEAESEPEPEPEAEPEAVPE